MGVFSTLGHMSLETVSFRPIANAFIFHLSDAAPMRSRLTEQLCDVALRSAGATVGQRGLRKSGGRKRQEDEDAAESE